MTDCRFLVFFLSRSVFAYNAVYINFIRFSCLTLIDWQNVTSLDVK